MENTYTCLRCGKSWKTHWLKNKNKYPKACKFCKSLKWNIPRIPKGMELLKYLLKIENLDTPKQPHKDTHNSMKDNL